MTAMEMVNESAWLAESRPDFADVKERWRHFWAGEVWKRPLVLASAPKAGAERTRWIRHHYFQMVTGDFAAIRGALDDWIATTDFLGELLPCVGPDLGPDQFAAFLGGEIQFNESSKETSWVAPMVDDWEEALPLVFDTANRWWQQACACSRMLAEHSRRRYLVACSDLHSNADTLLALRGAERLCMDFLDCPELIGRAMENVRAAYQPIYDGLYEAGGMSRATGTLGWIPLWCEGRYATIQCDFICMGCSLRLTPHVGSLVLWRGEATAPPIALT